MNRKRRLDAARAWLPKYEGKNVVRGYRKHFGVDWACAFIELEMLGVDIDPGYKESTLRAADAKARRKKVAGKEDGIDWSYQDFDFAYIVGYTSGGAPYGTRWEELDERDLYRGLV